MRVPTTKKSIFTRVRYNNCYIYIFPSTEQCQASLIYPLKLYHLELNTRIFNNKNKINIVRIIHLWFIYKYTVKIRIKVILRDKVG